MPGLTSRLDKPKLKPSLSSQAQAMSSPTFPCQAQAKPSFGLTQAGLNPSLCHARKNRHGNQGHIFKHGAWIPGTYVKPLQNIFVDHTLMTILKYVLSYLVVDSGNIY